MPLKLHKLAMLPWTKLKIQNNQPPDKDGDSIWEFLSTIKVSVWAFAHPNQTFARQSDFFHQNLRLLQLSINLILDFRHLVAFVRYLVLAVNKYFGQNRAKRYSSCSGLGHLRVALNLHSSSKFLVCPENGCSSNDLAWAYSWWPDVSPVNFSLP